MKTFKNFEIRVLQLGDILDLRLCEIDKNKKEKAVSNFLESDAFPFYHPGWNHDLKIILQVIDNINSLLSHISSFKDLKHLEPDEKIEFSGPNFKANNLAYILPSELLKQFDENENT